jgi:hypothetical protein
MWNLILDCLETVLVSVQDRFTVCAERTTSSEIILEAPNGTCGGIDPYTLMAAHGPHRRWWPNLPEQAVWLTQLISVPRGIYEDQLDD